MELKVDVDFRQVQADLDRLEEDIGARALASAVNRTMDLAQTEMVRQITSEFAVTREYVKQRLRIRRASYRQGVYSIAAELVSGDGKRRAANVIAFVERSVTLAEGRRRAKAGTQGQLFVQIKRQGGKKPIKGAFIGNKGRTVFERVQGTTMASRAKYAGSKHAEEIRPVQTIDVPQMFNTRRLNRIVVDRMRERFPEVFAREARFYVQRFSR